MHPAGTPLPTPPPEELPLTRVMAIYAHPDDPEFFSGGLLARFADAGKELIYVLATSGDKGTDDPTMTPERLVEIREAEQRAAAAVMGSTNVNFLRFPDGELMPNLELRKAITRVLRQHKPDIVITNDPQTVYFNSGAINHPDHRAIGTATIDAVFPTARDRLNFPDLWRNEGLEPHKVRKVYLAGTRDPNAKFNVTDVLDKKIAAISEHKSQIKDFEAMAKRQRDNRDPDFDENFLTYTESYRVLTLR